MNQRATAAKRGTEKSPARKRVSRHSEIRPISKLVNQIPHTNVQGFGDSHQGENTGSFFTPFQFTNVNRMQFGSFRQFFLTQLGKFSVAANRFANNFLMSQGFRHAFSNKQEAGEFNTVHSPLFLSCTFAGERVKKLKISVRKKGSGPRMGVNRLMKKKKKVLVVENETPTAMMIVSLLTQIGFDVQVAAKGQKGLEIAQEQKFDLILLDTHTPDISGCKICAELKQRHISYRTLVVFLSPQCGDEYSEQAHELGAADFIVKPFGAKDFISRVLPYFEESTLA